MDVSSHGKRVFRLLLLSSCLIPSIAIAQNGGDYRSLEERITSLYEENHSALVRVKAVYPPREEEDVPQVVIGTGFFISREGLIITNASIVYQPLRVWVEHDNIAYSADVLGLDERSNIAFLRTHTLPETFNFFHLVDRAEMPGIGSFVLRLSMPLEFDPSPSMGMVTGFESRFGERFFPCTYIRTNVPAGPGDGGSAYLDFTGRLLGIQVGSLPDVGSSYILPARAALRIRDDVLFSGTVTYGWIGFEVEIRSGIEAGRELVLSEVFSDSPADAAGLMEGDVLRKIGDYPIEVLDDLRNAMFYTRVGQYVDVTVNREGQPRRFSVRIVARPENEPMQITQPPGPVPAIEPIKESTDEGEDMPMPFEEDLSNGADTYGREDDSPVPDILQPDS